MNFCINPKKHIDYKELEESKAELKKLTDAQKEAKKSRNKEDIAKEKADYKRFMKFGPKQVVFYPKRHKVQLRKSTFTTIPTTCTIRAIAISLRIILYL